MKIGIIGGGSVGLLMASYFQGQHDLTIYVRREEQKEALRRHGLIHDQNPPLHQFKVSFVHDLQKEDLLMVCVKQYHLDLIIPHILHSNRQTALLFLQNGMGHLDVVDRLEQPVYLGVVEHGAYRLADHHVLHTGKGKVKVASYNGWDDELNRFVEQLDQYHFPFEVASDWYHILTEKLIVNAVINPVTALFDVKNGGILENRYMKMLAYNLCEEASTILELDVKQQWEKIERIARNTKSNTSSMLSDLKANRRTEIDAISGYLIQLGQSHAPLTTFIYNSIKALEVKKGIRT